MKVSGEVLLTYYEKTKAKKEIKYNVEVKKSLIRIYGLSRSKHVKIFRRLTGEEDKLIVARRQTGPNVGYANKGRGTWFR